MTTPTTPRDGISPGLADYPLLTALIERRSRRFGVGMTLDGGPLGFASSQDGAGNALTDEEEAALAFAAVGVTGYALGELPYRDGQRPESGSGNIMAQFYARTAPSPESIQSATLFVINDDGAWLIRRPQDVDAEMNARAVAAARAGDVSSFYRDYRVRVADSRLDVPQQLPYVMPFNKWMANKPGSTYFLPVQELSAFYINALLIALNEDYGYFIVDETNRFKPAGIAKFAQSKGGHLHDKAEPTRTIPIGILDTWIHEFAAVEQGAILQNLGLTTQALGLGGFPHFAHHPTAWPDALGFCRIEDRLSRTIGASLPMRLLLKLLGRDVDIEVPVGYHLQRSNGRLLPAGHDFSDACGAAETLLKPYCPPYYGSMEAAVLAWIDHKFGGEGTLRELEGRSAFRDPAQTAVGIPRPSQRATEAAIACAEYIYKRFGRFPATNGPFRTVLAYQAHHLDPAFYDEYYVPEALSATHRNHRH